MYKSISEEWLRGKEDGPCWSIPPSPGIIECQLRFGWFGSMYEASESKEYWESGLKGLERS